MKTFPRKVKNFVYCLEVKSESIQDLNAISDHFPNLQYLSFENNEILSVIEFTESKDLLKNIVIAEIGIKSDKIVLKNLPNLTSATLYDPYHHETTIDHYYGSPLMNGSQLIREPFSVISVEDQLPRLVFLQIVGFGVSFQNPVSLRELILENTKIMEGTPGSTSLSKLTPLTDDTTTSSIFPLLHTLRIRQENDIVCITNLPKLETLVFSNKSWWEECNETRYTHVQCFKIENLPSLLHLVVRGRNFHGTVREFRQNVVTRQRGGLQRISDLPKLELLDLEGQCIQIMDQLPKLKEIIAHHTKIYDISDSCIFRIEHLRIVNSYVPKLSEVNKFMNLESFVFNNQCFDVYEKMIKIDLTKLFKIKKLDLEIPVKLFGQIMIVNGSEEENQGNPGLLHNYHSELETFRILYNSSDFSVPWIRMDQLRSLELDIRLTKDMVKFIQRISEFPILENLRLCLLPFHDDLSHQIFLENLTKLQKLWVILRGQIDVKLGTGFESLKTLSMNFFSNKGINSRLVLKDYLSQIMKNVTSLTLGNNCSPCSNDNIFNERKNESDFSLQKLEDLSLKGFWDYDSLKTTFGIDKKSVMRLGLISAESATVISGNSDLKGLEIEFPNLRELLILRNANIHGFQSLNRLFMSLAWSNSSSNSMVRIKDLPILEDLVFCYETVPNCLYEIEIFTEDIPSELIRLVRRKTSDFWFFDLDKCKNYFKNGDPEILIIEDDEDDEEMNVVNEIKLHLSGVPKLRRIHLDRDLFVFFHSEIDTE